MPPPEPVPPYIVTLGFDRPAFGRLDDLRARFFPPERNQVPAHLTLFHHLPGDEHEAIDQVLLDASHAQPPIPLTFPTLKRTGGGMMASVKAPGLGSFRAGLARAFSRWLTPQDRQPFHAHVMLMNKAERHEAEAAFEVACADWSPFAGMGEALVLWRYLGGPWEEVESYPLIGTDLTSNLAEE